MQKWRDKHPDQRIDDGHTAGYLTNLTTVGAQFVIDAYHQLRRIEKSSRMTKHDLQAQPFYHHKRESIEAHPTTVFAALTVSHYVETQPAGASRNSARRYRTVQIEAGRQILIAADPVTRRPARCYRRDHHLMHTKLP